MTKAEMIMLNLTVRKIKKSVCNRENMLYFTIYQIERIMTGNRHSWYLYSNKRVILKSFWFLIKSHKYYSRNIDDSKITFIGP